MRMRVSVWGPKWTPLKPKLFECVRDILALFDAGGNFTTDGFKDMVIKSFVDTGCPEVNVAFLLIPKNSLLVTGVELIVVMSVQALESLPNWKSLIKPSADIHGWEENGMVV